MQTFFKSKFIFATGLMFLLTACNAGAQKDKQTKNDTELPPPPPPSMPPKDKNGKDYPKKCFYNQGLKYTTRIEIVYFSDTTVMGTIFVSQNLDNKVDGAGSFKGTVHGKYYVINFLKGPPTIGDASEWTNKEWKLETKNKKDILNIIFNAKNYDTNKWEDTDYQFVMVDCK